MKDINDWEKRRLEKVNKTNDFIIVAVAVLFLLMLVRLVWNIVTG